MTMRTTWASTRVLQIRMAAARAICFMVDSPFRPSPACGLVIILHRRVAAGAAIELKLMFTVEERACLRSDLLEYAASDQRISGAAITGSAAAEREDRWSDIDLAFGVRGTVELSEVLSDWTAHMYGQHRALHHVDVSAGAWIYRVFILESTLQVDLAFVPASEFRALAPTFRLVSGTANEPRQIPTAQAADLIGLAWLYALHARSSIARGRLWQAEYMISGVRDHALALACIRRGLPAD